MWMNNQKPPGNQWKTYGYPGDFCQTFKNKITFIIPNTLRRPSGSFCEVTLTPETTPDQARIIDESTRYWISSIITTVANIF